VSERDDHQVKSWCPDIRLRRRDVLILGAGAAAYSLIMPSAASSAAPARPALVEIANGKLRGETAGGVMSFKGIPYGAPTGGGNRFLPPQPPAKWKGVRDATKLGNQCPQVNPDYQAWLDASDQSEDCLYLNVWGPEHPRSSGKLPVMVWLHGGGYTFGSGGAPFYDGSNLALEGDVVVVTMNHRLNIFGFNFFETTDERFASAGNASLLDLIEALRWVRDNVAAFGGDPGNVTIFGESGGGGKVNALVGMPMARGLFHKAIAQSAPLLDLRTPALGSELTDKIYTKLGIKRGDIAGLQRVPTALLANNYETVANELRPAVLPYLAYGPTFDGVVFKKQSWHAGAPASSHDIPMIIGSNLDESIVWVGEDIHKPYPTDEAIAAKAIKSTLITDVPISTMAELVAASHRDLPELSPGERLVRVATDAGFRGAAVHQSELRARSGGAPVYSYECRWRTPCYGGKWALHGIDVPAVFGHTHYGIAYDGKDSDAQRTAADKAGLWINVQRRMLEAWAAFARSGNPSTPTLQWPAYDLTSRATMTFDGESKAENDPRPSLTRVAAQIF
jgi:para-nitrobenzyl esterase